jgi:threonine dehydrogenase-like Zn-dependent dehydrogenase
MYSVDHVQERLALAEQQGATPINFRDSDPVEQIMALEPNGVTRSIDAVGYEQVNRNPTVQADVITRNVVAVTSTGGGMGTVDVYNMHAANSAVAPRASEVQDTMSFSLTDFFFDELKWQAGPSDPIGLAPQLVALVTSGIASPSSIVSDVISIEDAPDAYRRFERHEIVKAVIAFNLAMSHGHGGRWEVQSNY